MPSLDLVLVFANFRRSSIFLPIIKELSRQFTIGILPLKLPAEEQKKTRETDDLFLKLCTELGAIILQDSLYQAKITIIPQWMFSDDQRKFISTHLKSELNFWMVGLAMGNIHYNCLGDLKIDKVLVIDLDLYRYRLSVKPEENYFDIQSESLVEVGLPFAKYPIFPDMDIGYLLANPTPFSLPHVLDRFKYLECVHNLSKEIPADCQIAMKPHNGIENLDYIVHPLAVSLLKIKPMQLIIKKIYKSQREYLLRPGKSRIKNAFLHLGTAYIYREILKRVKLLKDLTPYHNFSLELILPQVKKGMITGRSNSIWHGLFVKLPVYNCVDKRHVKEFKEKMHYHSMKYFEVPYCEGRMEFDDRHFSIIREETRQRDLIKWLSKELTAISSN